MNKELEYCYKCGEPTGKGGKSDGSLYNNEGDGPFCPECWDIDSIRNENAELRAKLRGIEEIIKPYKNFQLTGRNEICRKIMRLIRGTLPNKEPE